MGFLDGIGSALVGGAASFLGGSSANKSSAKEAAKSRQFTERQLKNRHQWEISDLKKAGLNPILSAGGTPSIGSSAMAQQQNIASDAVAATNTALQSKRLKEEIKNIRADTKSKHDLADMYHANTAKANSETFLNALALPTAQLNAKWAKTRSGKFFFGIDKMVKAISPITKAR